MLGVGCFYSSQDLFKVRLMDATDMMCMVYTPEANKIGIQTLNCSCLSVAEQVHAIV